MNPKSLLYALAITSLLIAAMYMSGCSSHDYDPDDYYRSLLSGEYGKGTPWQLNVILNGDPVDTDGIVRFDSKCLKDADLRFVKVIPGESVKKFKNVELYYGDTDVRFTIDYSRKNKDIHISGSVTLGEMTVDMTISK